jgi:hypothetical protein
MRDDAADRRLEQQIADLLIIRSILDDTRSRRLRRTKAEKIAREILAELESWKNK